jgi:hypothetical protein
MALRRAQYAEIREVDRTIQLDSLAILEEVMRHFFWKARILEGMGTEGDFNEVDGMHQRTYLRLRARDLLLLKASVGALHKRFSR